MKFLRFVTLLCVTAISSVMSAQSQRELSQLMRDRNEYYFTLTVDNPKTIQAINEICSVDDVKGKTVVCYANQQQYDNLLNHGYQPSLQTPPSLREEAKMWDGNRATYEWDSYPTYEQYESMMQAFPTSAVSGRTCTYMELGTLSSGRKIMGVRINNGETVGKPKFLYSSTIHGDETTGMILMLRLIDELCTSTDTRIVNLVNSLDIFIFPDANPDGTYYGGNNTVTGSRRANANGVDMNRNYPDPHSSAHPDGNAYQTETQWFMTLAETYPFVMGANFHGGAEVMNYPWDNTSTRHADDAWWQYISNEYVANTRAVYSGYMTDTYSSGITNGADWYMIGGGRQDYMNGYRQCREITIECSTTKTLAASQLNNYWNYNHTALLAYMEQCINGIHGVVRDANTNQIIEGATVTIQNHDDEYSIVSTHEDGYFHRPIKGGTWTLEVSKSGYHTETVNVTVADDQSVNITVYLTPYGAGEMECYEQTMPSAAGEYVMGYLNGSTLVMPSHNNASTVTTTSLDVTATDNGFSVTPGTTVPKVTLTAYGNDQYYISYNGRYLSRSNYGGSLSWGTSQSTRWNINSNGIYTTSNNRSYYLYYNNGSFTTSTTSTNNITFYVAGDCPSAVTYTITATANPTEGGTITGAGTYDHDASCTLTATANDGYTFVNWTENDEVVATEATYSFEVTADRELVANFEEVVTTITQNSTFSTGWNWWTLNVDSENALAELEAALGNNGVQIKAQDGTFVTHSTYGWSGSLSSLEVGKMYMIKVNSPCSISLEGTAIDMTTQSITLSHGNNWIGFYGAQSMSVNAALANLSATVGDKITGQDGSIATYSMYGWSGTLQNLVPGEGYLYNSKASSDVSFTFSSAK